jgi:soluble lytic murein transglycosylase-like protein
LRLIPATLLVCLAAAVPSEAQIYTWRDAAGHLVLSNKPRTGGEGQVTTYAVAGPTQLRTTAKPIAVNDRSRYDTLIQQAAERHGVSADLVRAVIQAESGFNRYAVSPKGAMGLMQLMPATARELGVSDPFHPADNIRGGVTYLAQLLDRFDQNVELALAAYNAGPGSVERYGSVPPYRETRNYVKKITGATKPAAAPAVPVIYKWVEVVNGKPTVRYSNLPPTDAAYEVLGKR